MSGVQIVYHAPDNTLRTHLARLARIDDGIDKVGGLIGEYMVGEIHDHFRNQTLWDDSPMPQSAAAKARGGQTLIDSGKLRDTYNHFESIGDEVLLGSDSIYAAIHDSGGDAGRGHKSHIDARPVLGVNPRNDADIVSEIMQFLARYE